MASDADLPPDRQPGDIPLAARLEQRRHRDPGVYRPGNNTLYFNNTTTTNTTDHSVAYGATGSVPVIGDWTGQ
jgi:hypothetical protein